GTLAWSLERAPTSDWGIPELAGAKAPTLDMDGQARADRHDVGAFEVPPADAPPRPPDGTLSVRSDAGLKSAGIFAPGGREVAYLFHNLPLAAGPRASWPPSRDFEGRPIAAGTYELRVVESALRWEYLHGVGNSGEIFPPGRTAPARPSSCAFDGHGRLVVGS